MHIILTADKRFWPDSLEKVIAIAHWCLTHSEELKASIPALPSPWKKKSAYLIANTFIVELYENMLTALTPVMNEIHQENHTPCYWRIILGPWLYQYISTTYDRYTRIKQAIELNSEIEINFLHPDSFIKISSDAHFNQSIKSDLLNEQIFTSILTYLGHTAHKTIKLPPLLQNKQTIQAQSLKTRILKSVLRLLSCRSKVLLWQTYLPKKTLIKLSCFSFGKIGFTFPEKDPTLADTYSTDLRNALLRTNSGTSEFSDLLTALLPTYMPSAYLENYAALAQYANTYLPKKQRSAIFTANGLYAAEHFKIWAAKQKEDGAKVLLTQHGTPPFCLKHLFDPYMHDLKACDTFFSWGGNLDSEENAKIVPMPANVLMSGIQKEKKPKGFLLVTSVEPRYTTRFFLPSESIDTYLKNQIVFLKELKPSITEQITLRPHRETMGWHQLEKIKALALPLTYQTWETPFKTALSACTLYICDHFSTTISQALANNMPSICFWDPELTEETEYAKPAFTALRKAQILHDTPKAAAHFINKISNDIDAWWQAEVTQFAVHKFCTDCANTSKDSMTLWIETLSDYI